MDRPPGRMVSASELAEFAYCPRAWYYRDHPPPQGRSEGSRRSAEAGTRYHRRFLAAEERHELHAGRYVALLLVSGALIVGGIAWFWFH